MSQARNMHEGVLIGSSFMLVCLTYFLTLKMEAICPCEISVDFHRLYIPEDTTFRVHLLNKNNAIMSYWNQRGARIIHVEYYTLLNVVNCQKRFFRMLRKPTRLAARSIVRCILSSAPRAAREWVQIPLWHGYVYILFSVIVVLCR
jgi:hypothetical protein